MADDSPFTTAPNGSDPNEAPTPEASSSRSVNMKEMAAAFQQAVKPLQEQLASQADQIQTLARALVQAQQGQQGTGGKAAPPAQAGSAEGGYLDRFVAEPEKTLESTVTGILQKTLGPYMNALGTAAQRTALQKEKDRFEQRYGEGKWEEIIQPRVEHVLQNVAEPLRMSEDHIMAAVASVKGSADLEGVLDEARSKQLETQRAEEASMRRSRGGSMLGVGRIGPSGEDTSIPEDGSAEVLASFARHGIQFSEKDFQSARKARSGRSLSFDEWQKARFPKDKVKTPEPEARQTDIPSEKLDGLP